DLEPAELDLLFGHLGGEAGLVQVALVMVDADHPRRAAALHLDGVEAGVAADIEHRPARKVLRDGMGEPAPLDGGEVSQEVVWRGGGSVQLDVVEPLPQGAYPLADLLRRHRRHAGTSLMLRTF